MLLVPLLVPLLAPAATYAATPNGAGSGRWAPEVVRLVQQMHAALGGAQLDAALGIELSGHYDLGGMFGSFTQLVDFKHGRDVLSYDVGMTRGQQGNTPEGAWWSDDKGLATVEDAPEARADAASESYEDRNGWAYLDPAVPMRYVGDRFENGRRFELLWLQPPGGRELTLWIDARTHWPDRVVEVDAVQGNSISYFSDYRRIDGFWFAFRERLTLGERSTDIVLQVKQARSRSQLSERDFAPPANTFDDAHLLGAGGTTQLPFEMRDGMIIVRASLNGNRPLLFALDSGGISTITPQTAKMLGIASAGNLPVFGVGEHFILAHMARITSMSLGQAQLSDQQFLVVSLPGMFTDRGRDEPLAGLLGYELFRRFLITIDYQHRTLTLSLPSLAPALDSAGPASERLPLRFDGRRPFVVASVDGVPGAFGVDTGDDGPLTLFAQFYSTHQFPIELPGLASGETGVGGAIATLMTRVDTLALGHLTLSRPLTQLNFAPAGAFASRLAAGNLGAQVLQNFIVTLDFPHRALYLQPSAQFGQAMAYNRSGLSLRVDGAGSPIIVAVSAGSPAALSGLRAGDRLLQINHQPQRGLDVYSIASQFDQPAGTRLELEVQRHGQRRALSLALREILPSDGQLRSVRGGEREGEAAEPLRPIS